MLALTLPSGGRVRTTWTPPTGRGGGWAWLQHGFLRGSRQLDGLAGLLSAAGLAVVRPDLPSLRPARSIHDARWLTEVAFTIGRAVDVGLPQSRGIVAQGPWTFVGHSAGAAVAVHVAACLAARHGDTSRPGATTAAVDGAALILLDPVDTVGGLMDAALRAGEPPRAAHVHACRPSRCNRHGATIGVLAERGWPVTHHLGLAHPDPERIPADCRPGSVPGPDPWLARICGSPGSPADVAALASQVRAQVLRAP